MSTLRQRLIHDLQLNQEQVRAYLIHLIEEQRVSFSHYNATVCALRFLYRVTLGRDWPLERLSLSPPTTPFAKSINKLLTKVDLGGGFQVGEDTITVPGGTRVFIAPARPPYSGFLPLSDLTA